MQSIRHVFGLCFLMIVFNSCQKKESIIQIDEAQLKVQALLKFSNVLKMDACPEGYSGYTYCDSSHTLWRPAVSSAIRKLGDSVFSRVILETKISPNKFIYLVETVPSFFDCEPCAPAIGAVIVEPKLNSFKYFYEIGEFGSNGKSPIDLQVVQNSKGKLFLKFNWTEVNQGTTSSGFNLIAIADSALPLQIQLEGSNEGNCSDAENSCYHFKYGFKDDLSSLPGTLQLKGSGNRIGSDGKLENVSDTTILILEK